MSRLKRVQSISAYLLTTALPALTLVFGLSASWLMFQSLEKSIALQQNERLHSGGQAVLDAFDLALSRSNEAIHSTSLMISTQEQLKPEEFARYTRRALTGNRTLRFLEWQPLVPAAELKNFERAVRHSGLPDFKLTEPEGQGLIPVRARESYLPVLYAWPEGSGAIGVDMGFDPLRMASKYKARDSGKLIASATFSIINPGHPSGSEAGFAISAPVYAKDNLRSVDARRQNLKGYVAGVIEIATLLKEASLRADSSDLDLLVFDLGDEERKLLFANIGPSSDWLHGTPPARREAGTLDRTLRVDIASRTWEIILHPRPEFLFKDNHWQSYAALIGGLLGSTLITGGLVWLQRSRRQLVTTLHAQQDSEKLIAQERQHLANVLDSTNAGTWDWNVQTGEVHLNERWADMLGYTLAELQPVTIHSWEKLMHPDDFVLAGELLMQHFSGALPYYTAEFRMRHKYGHWVWIAAHGRLRSQTPDGQPEWIAGTHLEISAQKRASQSLVDLKAALDIHAIISIADHKGRITYANDNFCAISGYTRNELLGKDHRIVHSSAHPAAFFTELWQTINSGKAWRGEICNRAKGGRLYWVDTTIAPILGTDGKPEQYIAIRYDITEAKLHQEHLLEAKEEAERASRTKSEFLANMSHEIRTPMNAIMGLTQLVLNTELQAQQRDYLTKVFSSSKALLGILNDILDYSKIEAGHLELTHAPVVLASVINDAAHLFASEIERKGLRLSTLIDPDLPREVLADPLRLGQILNNLIGNALKFTERGEIKLQVSRVSQSTEGLTLRFNVIDSGIGMNPEQVKRIFQAFAQADNSITRRFGGTGLGLSICQRLVRMMGGEISVSSEEGKGSDFCFTVSFQEAPSVGQTETPANGANQAHATLHFEHARVLLVEDNRVNLIVATGMLKLYDITPSIANDGAAAVELIKQQDFDLILMDQHMPVMDGCEASRMILALPGREKLPIIAMTAAVMAEDRLRFTEAGMLDFIAKPIEPDELGRVLRKYLPPRSQASNLRTIPPEPDSTLPARSMPTQLPGFDLPAALRRLGGKPSLLQELLLVFHAENASSVAQLDTLAAGDSRTFKRFIHTIKGAAGNLGATQLAEACAILEALPDTADNAPDLRNVKLSLTETLNTIALQVPPLKAPDQTEAPASGALLNLLNELQPYLEERELLPEALHSNLRLFCQSAECGHALQQLATQIDHFAYDDALNSIARIKATQGSRP